MEVQIDGANDIFIRVQGIADTVRIINDIERENHCPNRGIHNLHNPKKSVYKKVPVWVPVMGKEEHDEPSEDKSPESTEQEGSHPREIPFRLEGEEREAQEQAECDQEGLKDDSRVIKCHDRSNRVRFEKTTRSVSPK